MDEMTNALTGLETQSSVETDTSNISSTPEAEGSSDISSVDTEVTNGAGKDSNLNNGQKNQSEVGVKKIAKHPQYDNVASCRHWAKQMKERQRELAKQLEESSGKAKSWDEFQSYKAKYESGEYSMEDLVKYLQLGKVEEFTKEMLDNSNSEARSKFLMDTISDMTGNNQYYNDVFAKTIQPNLGNYTSLINSSRKITNLVHGNYGERPELLPVLLVAMAHANDPKKLIDDLSSYRSRDIEDKLDEFATAMGNNTAAEEKEETPTKPVEVQEPDFTPKVTTGSVNTPSITPKIWNGGKKPWSEILKSYK